MKGTIVRCLKEMIVEKYGVAQWEKIIEDCDVPASTLFLPADDFNDDTALKIVNATCSNLNITLEQAADAFGDYWINVYAQKMYSAYFKNKNSARELLLVMDRVHSDLTRSIANAHPPRFEYEWQDDRTLILSYISKRNMIDFAIGLIKGVGIFYKENLEVTKLSPVKIKVCFN